MSSETRSSDLSLGANPRARLLRPMVRGLLLLVLLYAFLTSIDLMGTAFKIFGASFAEALIRSCSHPVVGLFIGILATSLVQSSSTTTALTVGFVGGGVLPLPLAVPILMGANVGTTITNILVSFGFVARREDFRRAFAGATVHDFFNLCSLAVFFPLEVRFRLIERLALWMTSGLGAREGAEFFNPVRAAIRPVSNAASSWLLNGLGLSPGWAGSLLLLVSVCALVISLYYLVRTLRRIIVARVEQFVDRYLFRNDFTAFLLGVALTVAVQSSSVTTALIVPLVAAGVVSLRRCYPFTLGANVGTTATALLAALPTIEAGALGTLGVTAALVHLLFNLFGIAVFYPLRRIPLAMARRMADIAVESKRWAILFVLGCFFIIPALAVLVMHWSGG